MSLSVIVCATKPDLVEKLRKNIADTIGKDAVYEIIAIDNTQEPKSISKVYNEGGRKARYDNLLFIHQDAGFVTNNWLAPIEEKLSEPDCGTIGFAGTKVFYNYPSGWGNHGQEWIVAYYDDGTVVDHNRPKDAKFAEVVAIDGFAMFVRRDVWQENPFDEEAITGFHCYDVDFSLSLLPKYKNYVCGCVLAYHLSPGCFDEKWAAQTIRIYEAKWIDKLPCYASDVDIDSNDMKHLEERACFRAIKQFRKARMNIPLLNKHFLSFPLSGRHLEHLIKFSVYRTGRLFGK